jgi:hypothetical protein
MCIKCTQTASLKAARRILQSEVVIRRSKKIKGNPRGHISEDLIEDAKPTSGTQASASSRELVDSAASSSVTETQEEPTDELQRIRALLHPPPIPGVADWGIPGQSTEPCNPEIQVCHSVVLASRI